MFSQLSLLLCLVLTMVRGGLAVAVSLKEEVGMVGHYEALNQEFDDAESATPQYLLYVVVNNVKHYLTVDSAHAHRRLTLEARDARKNDDQVFVFPKIAQPGSTVTLLKSLGDVKSNIVRCVTFASWANGFIDYYTDCDGLNPAFQFKSLPIAHLTANLQIIALKYDNRCVNFNLAQKLIQKADCGVAPLNTQRIYREIYDSKQGNLLVIGAPAATPDLLLSLFGDSQQHIERYQHNVAFNYGRLANWEFVGADVIPQSSDTATKLCYKPSYIDDSASNLYCLQWHGTPGGGAKQTKIHMC